MAGLWIAPSRELRCSAPTFWAASQVSRSTMAGWVRWSDQYHWSGGTGLPLRVRPNTWYPVYFGLARIE